MTTWPTGTVRRDVFDLRGVKVPAWSRWFRTWMLGRRKVDVLDREAAYSTDAQARSPRE